LSKPVTNKIDRCRLKAEVSARFGNILAGFGRLGLFWGKKPELAQNPSRHNPGTIASALIVS
jgi:hypothetical protein